MKTDALKCLEKWDLGLNFVSKPDINRSQVKFSPTKNIPYYEFKDKSIIIMQINTYGVVDYIDIKDVIELEKEWDIFSKNSNGDTYFIYFNNAG